MIRFLTFLAVFIPLSVQAELRLITGISGQYYDSEEFDSGDRLNSETGLIPGYSIGVSLSSQDYSFSISVDEYSGEVDYEGRSQRGVSVDSSTDQQMREFNISIGRSFKEGKLGRSSVWLDLGYLKWNRKINGSNEIAGLDERYDWRQSGVRYRRTWDLNTSGQIFSEISVGKTHHADLKIDFNGVYDRADINLKTSNFWRFKIGWNNSNFENKQWEVALEYDYSRISESQRSQLTRASRGVGSVFQPQKDISLTTLSVNRYWDFY